jgi:putative transposase
MASKRYTTEQVIGHLRQAEILASEGKTVLEVVRELGISEQTYYRWCKEYGGMEVSQARRLKELEQEIGRLKRASNRFREVQITIRSTAVLVLRLCMPPIVSDVFPVTHHRPAAGYAANTRLHLSLLP